jgi:hypothetical protein
LPARQIEKLGAAFDHAEVLTSRAWDGDTGRFSFTPDTMPCERYYAICHRRHKAELAYVRAISARNLSIKCKAENAKRAPQSRDRFALEAAMSAASDHLDLIEKCRPNFATKRELIDANAAAVLAESLFEIAKTKFNEVGRAARITGTHPRSRSARSRLVSDGYVKTGKYKMIDGNRVPVLELIE